MNSFKEYKPTIRANDPCLKLKWYILEFYYTNVGNEEIRNPKQYLSDTIDEISAFTLVDSKGNELKLRMGYCPEYPVETYDPHPPDEILSPGKTHVLTRTYLFSDNNTVEPKWFQYYTSNILDIHNGAVVHYKQIRCLDDRYDSNNCWFSKTTADDIAWIVYQ